MSAAFPKGPCKSQSSEAVLDISCRYMGDQLVHPVVGAWISENHRAENWTDDERFMSEYTELIKWSMTLYDVFYTPTGDDSV